MKIFFAAAFELLCTAQVVARPFPLSQLSVTVTHHHPPPEVSSALAALMIPRGGASLANANVVRAHGAVILAYSVIFLLESK
jgi:hypothetical protein